MRTKGKEVERDGKEERDGVVTFNDSLGAHICC